mgnify:CR=1 FL=1
MALTPEEQQELSDLKALLSSYQQTAPIKTPVSVSGAMRRMKEGYAAPTELAAQTPSEIARGYGQAAKGFATQIPAEILGIPGGLEFLGRAVIPGVSTKTILPTSEKIASAIAGKPKTEEEKIGRKLGEIASFAVGPSAIKGAGKLAVGVPTATTETIARKAEDLGFKLSPSQLRRDVPVSARGATGWSQKNQTLANELASDGTGKTVKEISPTFIRDRLDNLGNQFDSLYKGKTFNIDPEAVQAIDSLKNVEQFLPGAAQVSAIKSTANKIIENFSSLAGREGARPETFGITGDALQTIRNDLSAAARSSSNRGDAHRIYELIDVIDNSIARNHTEVAEKLATIRPQYRNTIILEDLTRKGGISGGNISLERLGSMLAGRREGIRRTGDIDELGEIGRELKLRAMWESAGPELSSSEISNLLSKGYSYGLGLLGLQTRPARALQRSFAPTPESVTVPATSTMPVVTTK